MRRRVDFRWVDGSAMPESIVLGNARWAFISELRRRGRMIEDSFHASQTLLRGSPLTKRDAGYPGFRLAAQLSHRLNLVRTLVYRPIKTGE